MASSVIGALRVNLSMDTAEFARNASQAEKIGEAFGRRIGTSIRRNFVALGATVAALAGPAALGLLIRRTTEVVSAQVDLANRVGASVAAIQTLQHAAQMAGASQEGLAKVLGTLNARLGEAAREGAGQAYEALQRLGVSARELSEMDADERIKTLSDRMKELGYTTQQQADTLRSLGVRQQEVINLFLEGSTAIDQARKDLTDWGVLLSDIDAAKIESAGDAMERIGTVLQGIGNQVMIRLAPILEEVAKYFTDAARESGGFGDVIDRVIGVAIQLFGALNREIYTFRVGMDEAVGDVLDFWDTLAGAPPNLLASMFGGEAEDYGFKPVNESFGRLRETLAKPPSAEEWDAWLENIRTQSERAAAMAGTFDITGALGGSDGEGETEAEAKAAQKTADKMAARLEALRESLLTERQEELNSYAQRSLDLQDFYTQGAIGAQEFAEMRVALERDHAAQIMAIDQDLAEKRRQNGTQQLDTALGIANQISGALGVMFENNKGIAIATAIINTAQAITKTFAQYGATPWGFAAAAAAAAAGAAQIMAIRKTSKSSTSGSPRVSGSSGAGSGAGAASGGGAAATPAAAGGTLFVEGVRSDHWYSGDAMRDLAKRLVEYQKDGGKVIIA